MKKYMFDSNIFDKVLESGQAHSISQRDDIQVFITAKQAEEIARMSDDVAAGNNKVEKRVRLVLTLLELRVHMVPTISVLGHARVGTCILSSTQMIKTEAEINNNMHSKGMNRDNIADSIIAEAAIREGCILVTEDKDLYRAMETCNYPVLKWNDFLTQIVSAQ